MSQKSDRGMHTVERDEIIKPLLIFCRGSSSHGICGAGRD